MLRKLKFWGNVSDAEIEAIANRKLMESLLNVSIARTETLSNGLLDTSRRINQRAADIEKRDAKQNFNWLQRKARRWLGVDNSYRVEDIRFIREQFKTLGDAQAAGGKRYHVAVCQLTARNLRETADDQRLPYLHDAADSVLQLAARFIDETDSKDNNNDSESSASRA